jgi:uncharacterized protein with HEPN domain
MLDAAREAVEFARDQIRVDLNSDRKLVLALVKDIEIIGEAAHQVSLATRDQLPGIRWDDIIGILSHHSVSCLSPTPGSPFPKPAFPKT